MRELEAVLEDFKLARTYYLQVEKIFIADGDALIMPMERWEILLNTIRELFPECIRVTSYATPKSVLLKTREELFHLKELGLKMVYMGLESGSNEVLKIMKKGNTAEDIIANGTLQSIYPVSAALGLINYRAGAEGVMWNKGLCFISILIMCAIGIALMFVKQKPEKREAKKTQHTAPKKGW